MSSRAVETGEPAAPALEPAAAPASATVLAHGPRRVSARSVLAGVLAAGLVILGAALLAANLGLLATPAEQALRLAWPVVLIATGLAVIAAGRWPPANQETYSVTLAGAGGANLLASIGFADLRLAADAGSGELATVEWPGYGGSKTAWIANQATLRLDADWPLWAGRAASWRVGLAQDLPWRLNLRSTTGDLDLDLTQLSLTELRLNTLFGDVKVTLPKSGGADLDLSLGLGDLWVTVPAGLEVKLKLKSGLLADVEHDDRRFIQLSPNELGTPLYAAASRRCTLTIWLGAGRLRLQ